VLIGGMIAKVGIEGEGKDSSYRIGARSGPWERSVVICLGRLCETWFGLFGRDVWRFEGASFLEPVVDWALQHSAAACARVARPVAGCASAARREDRVEFGARHLHFQTLLQVHGFKSESTGQLL
jgi:hypothetical protein